MISCFKHFSSAISNPDELVQKPQNQILQEIAMFYQALILTSHKPLSWSIRFQTKIQF